MSPLSYRVLKKCCVKAMFSLELVLSNMSKEIPRSVKSF